MKTLPPPIGERIRAARLAAGMSQAALATFARIDPQHVSNIERGVRNPSRGLVLILAGVVGVKLGERDVRRAEPIPA